MAAKRYWLFKSEPGEFSIGDLENAPDKTTFWDGVRNYQARNHLRDDVSAGDGVLFYYSNAQPNAVVGTARVVRAGYPDHTQFDPGHIHYDGKSNPDNPRWFMVDIRWESTFKAPIPSGILKADPGLSNMVLFQNSRLSVQPVRAREWKRILELAKADL